MNRAKSKSAFTIALLAMLLAVPVYGENVNKSVRIAPGAESVGESSVNGSITVGEGAIVRGDLDTVNGNVRIRDNAKIEHAQSVNGSVSIGDGVSAGGLESVNGSVTLGKNSSAAGDLETVNGRIVLEEGSEMTGDISSINGDITLDSSRAEGNLRTVNGNVELRKNAFLKGDLVVEKPNTWSLGSKLSRDPEIIVGPDSTVGGVIRLEREVKLYISETADVGGIEGVMSADDAIYFSGDRP